MSLPAQNDTNQSRFDPSRKTVGSIYREAALKNTDKYVEAGDLSREFAKSLVDDLNATIQSNPFEGRPFYITVYEKKDLQMKRAVLRRFYNTLYRPYPEDDTTVFYVEPRSNTVKFCWCLPHHSNMDNALLNFSQYAKEYIDDIRAWKKVDLKHFGFDTVKVQDKQQLVPSKENRDKIINSPKIYS